MHLCSRWPRPPGPRRIRNRNDQKKKKGAGRNKEMIKYKKEGRRLDRRRWRRNWQRSMYEKDLIYSSRKEDDGDGQWGQRYLNSARTVYTTMTQYKLVLLIETSLIGTFSFLSLPDWEWLFGGGVVVAVCGVCSVEFRLRALTVPYRVIHSAGRIRFPAPPEKDWFRE